MSQTFPYTSSDYFQQEFDLSPFRIEEQTIYRSQKIRQKNHAEFILIRSDNLSIEINSTVKKLASGLLLQLMPYHFHRFLLEDQVSGKIIRMIIPFHLVLQLSTNKQLYARAVQNLDHFWPIVKPSDKEQAYMMRMIQFFKEEASILPGESDPLIFSIISTVSYLFQKNLRKNYARLASDGTLGWRCIQYIHFHHQDSSLTKAMVAKQLGISTTELDTEVRKVSHSTFKQVVTHVRLLNALSLLSYSDLAITQIVTICGFKNEASLYHLCQTKLQQTPNQIRQAYVNQASFITPETNAWNIFSFLVENCHQPMTTDLFCNQYHLSKKQLTTILNETFQLSFSQLLQQARIQRAYLLTTYTNDTLEEITQKIGLASIKTTYHYIQLAKKVKK